MKKQYTFDLVKSLKEKNYVDEELKKIIIDFCKEEYISVSSDSAYEIFRTLSYLTEYKKTDFKWENFKSVFLKVRVCYPLPSLLLYLIKTDYLTDTIKKEYLDAKHELKVLSHTRIHRSTYEKMNYPHSLYLLKDGSRAIINAKNKEVYRIIKEFIDVSPQLAKKSNYSRFFLQYENSLQGSTINGFEDINYETFKAQYLYFKDNKAIITALFYFYFYVWDVSKQDMLFPTKSGILYEAMKRHTFATEYTKGFRAYYHNPYESAPLKDKWILIQSEDYKGNLEKTQKLHGSSIDFTTIKAIEYRATVKSWIWENTGASLLTKIKYYGFIRDFLNFTNKRKNHERFKIRMDETLIYKNHLMSTLENDSYIERVLSAISVFLKYCNDSNKIVVEKNTLAQLSHSYSRINKAEKINDDDLVKIANKMKDNTYDDISYNLYYALFYLLLESEMRISHVLSLDVDSIQETVKSNQYILEFRTKTSGTFEVNTSITRYVKRHLDSVISATAHLRSACSDKDIKNRIFLKRNSSRKHIISPLSIQGFNNYLKKICIELGIKPYNSKNLRDTYMTKSVEYAIRKGLSQLTQAVLTGHKNIEITEMHYWDNDITEMLEILYETEIGDIHIEGEVLLDSPGLSTENTVEKGCGYCKIKHCDDDSYFDCLICKKFVTTVDRKGFFEERVIEIDNKLTMKNLRHDVEDLQVKKQLILAYIREIYIVSAISQEVEKS